MPRFTDLSAVTTLAASDVLAKDNPTTGSKKIAYSDLLTQLATELTSNFTIEEVADAAARNALTVTTGQIAKRLVRLADTGVIYAPSAAGTGAGIWIQWSNTALGTTAGAGILELATDAETQTGTDTARAITPASLAAWRAALPGSLVWAAAVDGVLTGGSSGVSLVLGQGAAGVFTFKNQAGTGIATFNPIAAHVVGGKTITGAGRLIIGLGAESDDNAGVIVRRTVTGSIDTGTHGYRDESTYDASGTGTTKAMASFDTNAGVIGTSNYGHMRGFQSRPYSSTSGTVDQLAGVWTQPTITAGTVTLAAGVNIENMIRSGGTVTSQYGLRIAALSGATNNFGLVVEGDNLSIFAGRLQLNRTTVASASYNDGALTINDKISFGGDGVAYLFGNLNAAGLVSLGGYVVAGATNDLNFAVTTGGKHIIANAPFRLSNAYVAGAPAPTGYLVIYDSTGTAYQISARAA